MRIWITRSSSAIDSSSASLTRRQTADEHPAASQAGIGHQPDRSPLRPGVPPASASNSAARATSGDRSKPKAWAIAPSRPLRELADEGGGNRLPPRHGPRRLSRHRRLRQGRDRQLARFRRHGRALRSVGEPSAGRRRRLWGHGGRGHSPAWRSVVSAGGYLRDLTRKAEAGQFTLGPMLMALIGRRKREKRRA